MELRKSALIQKIEDLLILLNIKGNQATVELLYQYLQQLLHKNQVMNLTSTKTIDELIDIHLYDSLMVGKIFPALLNTSGCIKALDIGSGGGFPAIPMAIVALQSQWILVESIQKKASFLRETAKQLKLSNIILIPFRIEDFIKSCPIPPLNLITIRAVGKIEMLYPYIQIFRRRHIPVMLWKNPTEVEAFNQTLKNPIPFTDHPYPVKNGNKHILLLS